MKEVELGIVTLVFILFLMINYTVITEMFNPFFVFGVIFYFVFFEFMGLKIKTNLKEIIIFGMLLLFWVVSFPFYILLDMVWGWMIFTFFPSVVYLSFLKKEKRLYMFTIVLTILFSVAHFIVLGQFYADVHLFFLPVMFFMVLAGLYFYFTNWPSKRTRRVKKRKRSR